MRLLIVSGQWAVFPYALWLRRFMVDELNQDYVKFAQVKGLSKSAVNKRHIFRNAIIPLVIYLPSDLLLIISGSLVIETLYSIPGTGGLLTTAIFRNTLTKAQRYLSRKDAGEDLFDPEMEALIPLLKREIPAHIHAHRSDDILTALRIVKEFDLRCSIIHTTGGSAIVPQIAAAGIIPIVGP